MYSEGKISYIPMLCLYISKTEKITDNTPAWYAYKTFIK